MEGTLLEHKGVSCNATMVGGQLSMPDCKGFIDLVTITGPGRLSCGSLDSAVFYGPVFVEGSDCSQVMMGKEYCGDSDSIGGTCYSRTGMYMGVMILVSIIMILLLMNSIRCLVIKIRLTKNVVENMHFPMIELIKEHPNGILLEEDQAILEEEMRLKERLTLNAAEKKMALSWKQILLMFLFMNFRASEGSKTATMVIGETLTSGINQISLIDSSVKWPLVEVYHTSPFDSKIEWDSHYFHSSCQRNINCTASEPHGIRTSPLFWIKGDKRVSYIRFCRLGVESVLAPLSGFCVEWFVEISIRQGGLATVFEIGLGEETVDIRQSAAKTCEIISTKSSIPLILPPSTIILDDGLYRICPMGSNSDGPVSGKIGDIQIDGQWNSNIPLDLASCSIDYLDHPQCYIKPSWMKNELRQCKTLPGTLWGFDFSMEDGFLVARNRKGLAVGFDCNVKEPIAKPGECGVVSHSVFGIEDSPFGYMMKTSLSVLVPGKMINVNIPCVGPNILVPCDGIGSLSKIPSRSSCMNSTEIQMHIADNDHFVHVAGSHMGSPTDGFSLPNFGNFNLSFLELLAGSSWTTIALIILVVLMILKK